MIAMIIMIAMLNFLVGCTCCQRFTVDEVKSQKEGKITNVFLNSGENIEFDEDGGMIDDEKKVVKGYSKDENQYGTLLEYKFDEIKDVEYRYISASKSIIIVTVAGAAIAGFVAGLNKLSKESD